MTERRRWKAEEKLALINEIKEKGQVVETCRKYGVDPSMFYRWKPKLRPDIGNNSGSIPMSG